MERAMNFLSPTQARKLFIPLLATSFCVYFLILLNNIHQPSSNVIIYHDAHSNASIPPSNSDVLIDAPSVTTTSSPITPPLKSPPRSPHAIAIFLGADYHAGDDDSDEADWYYMGARTLIYQLLHSPATKLKTPTPVVILVTKDVRESKRIRLQADGATVIEIEEVDHAFSIGEPRYAQVLTKLRVFDYEVMPYEKVFLMDTDMVIRRPLDAIFDDESTRLNTIDPNATRTDTEREISPLPQNFTFAATPESAERDHEYPYLDLEREKTYFNVGCMLFSPSKEIYHYYLAILGHPELFGHGWPEQDLLNYIHRLDGPMPWTRLHYSWYLNWPNQNDLDGDMAIIHSKFWAEDFGPGEKYALRYLGEMQGYWIAKEAVQARA
ncbi:hypothetical protein PENNAL_c0097G10605 [Penicillium nalgiovense]|uniref:Glycosyltransferase family 8 protein n=1 Tax=Penicillium nalgiovense TaxID=60175 RepID=A0A1V6XB57_PENNA|nr:hypothetical protein PENNAL_c0097G10605 [Penicillium nalgiovense]